VNVSQTQRLNLRLMALQDVENVHGLIYADPEVAIPLVGHVLSLDEVRSPRVFLPLLARSIDEPGLLGIERIADHAFIGIGGLLEVRRAADRERFAPPAPTDALGAVAGRAEAELMIALGRSYWNRGYALEAATATIAHGFQSLRFTRIVASVAAANERGQSLLRRLGFRLVPNRVADPRSGAGVPGLIGILDAPSRR
jgi:RimJ/RimL family protein N-acetyltransferase